MILLVGLLGCDEAICVDGVCADPEETRTFPGPCESRQRSGEASKESIGAGTFEYDASGQLTRVAYVSDGWGGAMSDTKIHSEVETRWTYDAIGENLTIEGAPHWTFDADQVTGTDYDTTTIYDRASFAFIPEPGLGGALHPRAVLGAIRQNTGGGVETYTWTRAGQVLTRVSTYSGDGRVRTDMFDLDDRDRIVRAYHTSDGDIDETVYRFDGDRLVDVILEFSSTHYTYDRGGNLIQVQSTYGDSKMDPEVYSYACWD